VSGEICLFTDWITITFFKSSHVDVEHQFCWNYRMKANYYEIGGWAKWEELRDLEKLAEKIKKGRVKAQEDYEEKYRKGLVV